MNAHGETLETWVSFLHGECDVEPRLTCVECGRKAQGNVSCEDGPVCDACHVALGGSPDDLP